jgi:predicted CxxxxCH...CXXCH cytochrome family protein
MRSCSTVVLVFAATLVAACTGGRYHPDGFAAGAMHGPALKQQTEDCRTCHGADLAGGQSDFGAAPSCDGCHDPVNPTAWRTNCTFCHGGVDNDTGAPPRNIDGTDLIGPFPAHPIHVTGSDLAVAYDCKQCHTKAIDVLSPGHVFDDTPGEAENDYGNGLAPQTVYTRADRTCANNYCHGDGRTDSGTVSASAGPMTCDGCHAVQASGAAAWSAMSGAHSLHLAVSGVTCADCHHDTTTDGASIAAKDLHINGVRDVAFAAAGLTFDPVVKTCNGTCHGVDHSGFGWGGGSGGSYHPAGFAAPNVHGPEMELQRQDCRGCHGGDLTGGTGPSCDSCHEAGWRTKCTYCHGGGKNSTGAPPRDLGSSDLNTAQSFVAHTAHVTGGIASPFDCTQCHVKPTDVMSASHAFDSTPAKAEVSMAAGLSAAGTYDGNGTCTNLYCHGNGRGDNGTATDGMGTPTCSGCHPGMNSGSTAWSTMSGSHRKHLGMGYSCDDCHGQVSGMGGTAVLAPSLHVDGKKETSFPTSSIVYDPNTKRCTGSCHESHNYTW